jgi:predicted transcriptional regulator
MFHYALAMTKLLEQAFAAARALPPEMQDAVARMLLDAVASEPLEIDDIPPEDLAAIKEGLADLEAGRIATDEEIEAVLAKYKQ